ncbi:MAG: tetratricopeptide repeat protein [Candidatus Omnitrophica bacterium]|jgi:tetratricopeptide (TPR) repeat protein|nr:tetratricopeptide repeat protein [Candidatus Omnitrophota bacterium]MDD5079287.1 tetratricopeptide repeat protein [Candidatus Omnitrophota bacterium]
MKKYMVAALFFIFSAAIGGSIEAEQPGFSREERIKKASELYISGKLFLQDGDYDRADDAFKKAQELLTDGVLTDIPGSGLGDYMREMKMNPEEGKKVNPVARKTAIKPLSARSKKANDLYNRGVEAIQRREYNQAEASLKESIRLNPKDKDAYYNLGVLYENYFVDKRSALACYQRYVRLAPRAENVRDVRSWIDEIKKGITPYD